MKITNVYHGKFRLLYVEKFIRVMKITSLLLLITFVQVSAATYSQPSKMNLNYQNVKLSELLDNIERSSDFRFFYESQTVDLSRTVSINSKDSDLKEVLNKILGPDLTYEIISNNIVVIKNAKNSIVEVSEPQQSVTVSGQVTNSAGVPLAGVTVMVKGTTKGVITDADGNYSLPGVTADAILQFSFVGMKLQEIPVSGRNVINVTMTEEMVGMDEIIVVGYGTQKKKLVTGSTVQVKGEDMVKLNTVTALGALQSQTPGVNIIENNGQPGEGFKVTIRGLGTVGNSSPLFVIDGVAGGDISALNPSDIESVDVLKDAASAAIYGARAANGVVLVTTKQGRKGKVTVTYDNFVGAQYISKMPGLLNAKEYMEIQDMRYINDGHASGYDWAGTLPDNLYKSIMDGTWTGTDWISEAYKKGAPIQNHSFNITGGSDFSKYSLGFSNTQQDGILGWNKIDPVNSDYRRNTARINSDYVILRNDRWDVIKIGETLNFSYSKNNGIQQGDIYWNDVHNYMVASPLLPVYTYDENNKVKGWYDQNAKEADGWIFNPKEYNPLALSALSSRGKNESNKFSLQASAYLQVEPIENLVFKSQYGYKYTPSASREYTNVYRLSTQTEQPVDQVSQSAGSGYSWTLDNTLAYHFSVLNDHIFDAVIGQSVEKWGYGQSVGASAQNTIYSGAGFDYAWVSNAKPTELSQVGFSGYPWGEGGIASFFGRVNYNYHEKYLATVTLRADGSSNFAKDHRWGYFPSASVGWVLTEEDFLKGTNTLNFLKLRASWGQNGNCNIDNFQYLTPYSFSSSYGYAFDKSKNIMGTGAIASILANPDVSWETSEQIDIGVEARFLKSRLGLVFDWYNKATKDWLVQAPIAGVYGLTAPYVNGGDVKNSGIEFALNWNDKKGAFGYGANFNLTYNKNEVTRIANTEGIIHGPEDVLSESTGEYYRCEVGEPIGFFWGYKTAGVFQNVAQVNATETKLEGAQPGDLIFVDVNGDGQISEKDRTKIGDPHPDFILGFGFNMEYQGFHFSVIGRGSFGQQIAKSYRSFGDNPLHNYTKDVYGVWTGEGTSNKLPKLNSGSYTNWNMLSDIYLEDGNFVKIASVTIGYDFKQLMKSSPIGIRLYVSAKNLFTFTNYSGMDPEIGYGYEDSNWMSGIDLGSYPSAKSYLVGVNIRF